MKIVYAYIVGDIIHVGHISALENAKAFGDKLIVGVLTDKAVLEKKSKPIISFPERLRIVGALKCVDAVVTQDTYSPIKNVLTIKPDILMESDSHNKKDIAEVKAIMDSIGGKVIVMPYYIYQSSSNIKKKIKNESLNKEKKK